MPTPLLNRLLAPLALLALAACGPVLHNATPPDTIEREQAAFLAEPYRIRPGDLIEVRHRLATEFNDTAVVRPDGQISLPLVPSVMAAGFTTDQLEGALKTAYSRDLRDVELSVLVRSFATQRVFVGGEVERPGMVDLIAGETLMQALYSAGGLKPTARTGEVVVVRHGAGDQRLVFAVDLDQVMSGTALGQDVKLQPLDTVIVPRSDIAQADLWVEQYIRNLLPAAPSTSVIYSFNEPASSSAASTIGR
jgi:protein involved in polysaccharide export with SLBB domain